LSKTKREGFYPQQQQRGPVEKKKKKKSRWETQKKSFTARPVKVTILRVVNKR